MQQGSSIRLGRIAGGVSGLVGLAVAELGADRTKSVLVGDSPVDEQCAGAAAVAFLAVPWAPATVTGTRLSSFDALTGLVAVRPLPTS